MSFVCLLFALVCFLLGVATDSGGTRSGNELDGLDDWPEDEDRDA